MLYTYLFLFAALSYTSLSQDCPTLLPPPPFIDISALPDPFSWYPAQEGRVNNTAEWSCRQKHISTLLQQMELGDKPPLPSTITGSLSGSTFTVSITNDSSKTISFDVTISLPTTGTPPYPAVIAYGGLSIPLPPGIATITFPNDKLAAQVSSSSRGQGLFYDLYGSTHSAGAMIAWAWGVSALITALESTPSSNIDTTKLGVTGCSRNGKGALVAGAFDSRIALTIPQESGAGGSGCWRLCDAEEGAPNNVQTAGEIVQENVWFSSSFNSYTSDVSKLPFDHHMLAGLIAPRPLLSIDNSGYQWLGPWSSWGCMGAARAIWSALGVEDYMGYSMSTTHTHCSFPDQQRGDLFAFLQRFLLGDEGVDTVVVKNYADIDFDSAAWVDWDVPVLV